MTINLALEQLGKMRQGIRGVRDGMMFGSAFKRVRELLTALDNSAEQIEKTLEAASSGHKYLLTAGIYSSEEPTSVWDTLEEAQGQLPVTVEWKASDNGRVWSTFYQPKDARWGEQYAVYKLPYRPEARL